MSLPSLLSIWQSVAALCIAVIMPFTKRRLPPAVVITRQETTSLRRSQRRQSWPVEGGSIMLPREGNHKILVDHTGVLRRARVRSSLPSAITVVPPISGSITISAHPDRPELAVTATLAPPMPVHSQEITVEPVDMLPEPVAATSTPPAEGLLLAPIAGLSQKRPATSIRLPNVFRRKIKRASAEDPKPSSHLPTPSRSSSPRRRRLLAERKSEHDEPATAHGRVPYMPNPDDREQLQMRFVNPFRRRARRSDGLTGVFRRCPCVKLVSLILCTASPASSVPSTPDSARSDLPSPPTTAELGERRQRRSSLVSYLNRAMRLHDTPRSPSPRRWSGTSSTATSSSDIASSSASSRRSYSLSSSSTRSGTSSDRPIARTQPYGAPYYAPMPVPTSRRSSSGRVVVGVGQSIGTTEEREHVAQSRLQEVQEESTGRTTAFEDDSALGLSLGEEVSRHRRHQSDAEGAGTVT
jgi:hypothetical protein